MKRDLALGIVWAVVLAGSVYRVLTRGNVDALSLFSLAVASAIMVWHGYRVAVRARR